MGVNVNVSSSDTWWFFQRNQSKMEAVNMIIASNDETNYSICLTSENEKPLYTVYRGDDKIYEETVSSESTCIDTAKRLYCKYLFPVFTDCYEAKSEDDSCATAQYLDDQIYEREDALMNAANDFLQVLLCCSSYEDILSYDEDLLEVFIDDICTYLASEHQIFVYRPMWVIDDAGEEEFNEFPYLDHLSDSNVDDDVPLPNT